MFTSTSPDAEIKLIDFGLSQKFAKHEHLRDAVGTVYTMAPELILGDYDSKADIWSVGVISFMLLSSSMPFYAGHRSHLIKKILAGHYKFGSSRWKNVTEYAKQFIRALLESDPTARPTADVALTFRWLNTESDTMTQSEGRRFSCAMDVFQSNMHAFAEYNMLKKLALLVIAYKSTYEEIGILRNLFAKFDKDRNGEVSLEEFKEVLSKHYSYTDEEAEELFRGVDIDGTGTLQYCEFVAATLEALGAIDEERLAEAFDRIDVDDTGYITVSDLRSFLGDDVPTEYLDAIISEADNIDTDHKISYPEFLAMWNQESDEQLARHKGRVRDRRWSVIESRNQSFNSSVTSVFTDESEELPSECESPLPVHDGKDFFQRQRRASIQDNARLLRAQLESIAV